MLSNKIDPGLAVALNIPEELMIKNDFLNTGFDQENDMWEVVVKYHGDLETITEELDITAEILTEKFAIITLSPNKIELFSSFNEIEFIEKPKLISPMLNLSLNRSCITPVQNDPPYRLRGNGVIVGIIDSGIDYSHPDFINEDGTSRILYIWDQTIQGNPPQGFNVGTEYPNEMINEALEIRDLNERMRYLPHIDTAAHGTHVAGIAAGNGSSSAGMTKGVAPEASLIVVKLGQINNTSLTKTTEIMRALKYIVEKSQNLNMPVAINISYGTNEFHGYGSSLFTTFIDDMSLRWKNVTCVAAGNEASAGHHRYSSLIQNVTEEMEFVISGGLTSFVFEISKSYVDKIDIEIISPNGDSTGRISFTEASMEYELKQAVCYIEFGNATPFSEADYIVISLFPLERYLNPGIWTVKLYPINITVGRCFSVIPITGSMGRDTFFLLPSVQNTITTPANSVSVVSVGGYDARTNRISYFSGRGLIPYSNSPDLVAPAENIIAAVPGGGYDSFTGTSMACPHVTGSAALLMQWGIAQGRDPFLYGQKVKACLKFGARRTNDMNYPNYMWGFGTLCLLDSFRFLT